MYLVKVVFVRAIGVLERQHCYDSILKRSHGAKDMVCDYRRVDAALCKNTNVSCDVIQYFSDLPRSVYIY